MEKRGLIETEYGQLQGARFSRDRRYRYQLWRTWDTQISQRCVFVGLNPSAADERSNDPTIRRCVGFAENWKGRWRCGGLAVVNLFGYCTHDPAALNADPDARVICIWGNHGEFANASERQSMLCAPIPLANRHIRCICLLH